MRIGDFIVKMPPEVKDVLEKQKILPIATATADKDRVPNVVFVTMWKILDDETILFVDNFFNKTRKNIKASTLRWDYAIGCVNMALVAYDADTKQSYQLKGTVAIETEGERFEIAKKMADSKKLPGKAAFVFQVKEIYNELYGPEAGEKIA